MLHRILSDVVVVVHFLWIIFMVLGFVLTVRHFFRAYVLKRSIAQAEHFFDRWVFRTLHLSGIGFVVILMLLGRYCPLTVLENYFRAGYDPEAVYPGSFMIHYLELLIYPRVNPLAISVLTIIVAVFSTFVFVLRPPKKVREILKRH